MRFYEGHEWTVRAVPLQVTKDHGIQEDADTAIAAWFSSSATRVLIISGDFGSGKTWLARRFCYDLARRQLGGSTDLPLPVFIPLLRLRQKPIETIADLLSIASPEPMEADILELSGTPVLIVLDGLDELLVVASDATEEAKRLLSSVSTLVPKNTKLVITCRTQVLDRIQHWIDLLFEDLGGGSPEDRTRIAIDRALGRGTSISTALEIRQLEPEQADSYLSISRASGQWRQVSDQPAFRELASMPFALALLEEALPSLVREKSAPDLPALYRAAVLSWLHRDRRAAAVGTELLLNRLEEIAEAVFTEFDTGTRRYDYLLVHAGILQNVGSDRVMFRHFSLFEYFVARVLQRQLTKFSAMLLSRLNLVYMYNVNRFLVPLLLGGTAPAGSPRLNSVEKLELNGRASVRDFLHFVEETHWRERQGYGFWTIKTAQDGTIPFEGQDPDLKTSLGLDSYFWAAAPSLEDPEAPVTGVSWYDAFQCCRWAGGRLPTADELAASPTAENGPRMFEWSSSWLSERESKIAVVGTSATSRGSKQGMNPDLRSELVGFRIFPLT